MYRLSLPRGGFTLLETLVALVIVVTILGAGASLSHAVFKVNDVSEDQARASSLAEDLIGIIRTSTRSGVPVSSGEYPAMVNPDFSKQGSSTAAAINWCTTDDIKNKVASCSVFWDRPFTICNAPLLGASLCPADAGKLQLYTQRVNDDGEMIAVLRDSPVSGEVIIDDGLSDPTGIYVPTVNVVTSHYDFYRRKVDTGNRLVTVKNIMTGLTVQRKY